MKKYLKILSIALLAVVILIITVPFAFKGKIKGLVIKEANKGLNAKLEIGKVNFSLLRSFPDVYIGLNDVLITGQDKFEGDTLVTIGSLALSAGILDLIGGSPYEIKRIKYPDHYPIIAYFRKKD